MTLFYFLLYYIYHLCFTCIDFYDPSSLVGCWFVVYIRRFIYKFLNVCLFDYTAVAGSGKVGPVNQVNNTSWVAVVTPIDRPKSVRNRCVIELFCGVVCVVTLPLWRFCWCMGFCHRTELDLFLFLKVDLNYYKIWSFYSIPRGFHITFICNGGHLLLRGLAFEKNLALYLHAYVFTEEKLEGIRLGDLVLSHLHMFDMPGAFMCEWILHIFCTNNLPSGRSNAHKRNMLLVEFNFNGPKNRFFKIFLSIWYITLIHGFNSKDDMETRQPRFFFYFCQTVLIPLSQMLRDILEQDHMQWHPTLIKHCTNVWLCYLCGPYYRVWPFYQKLREVTIEHLQQVRHAYRRRLLLRTPWVWSILLTNKPVGTIWRALSKPPQRRQGPDLRPLWFLVGTSAIKPELASKRAEHSMPY